MITNEIRSIKNLTLHELKNWIIEKKYSQFRDKQVFNWIYRQFVNSPDEMLNIPQKLRDEIKNYGNFNLLEAIKPERKIINSSKKYLFKLVDGNYI